ncbi:MAG: hypothetical protein ABSG61_09785 [Gemmatimonadales bacterium]
MSRIFAGGVRVHSGGAVAACVLVLAGCGKTSPTAVTGGSDPSGTTTSTTTWYSQSGGTATLSGKTYTASSTDRSGVTVTGGGTLSLNSSTISTTGSTSSSDSSSFYGLDAGVLASGASTIRLAGSSVKTTGTGANGVFATGSGTSITLVDDTIACTGQLGHGVDATLGATLSLTNVLITTGPGANSAAIATDRGGGTITATGGTFTTSGADAPGIYSTGSISVSGATIVATGSEGAVIEGANAITLTNTALTGTLKRGVMIYQSMSGDAQGTRGVFTMTGGSLTAMAGPLFYVTNSTGVITLSGVATTAASDTVVQAAAGGWGTSGSNGGTAILAADAQTLMGNLVTDSYGSITVTLKNGSSLTGAINTAALTLDASSTWTVTANSALTSLTGATISGSSITNIVGNGYTVTYDASLAANSWLGGLAYSLPSGGQLIPK